MGRIFPCLQILPRTHPLFRPYRFSFSSFHHDLHLFDQMPQRVAFQNKLHSLLKSSSADPLLLSSIHSLSIKANRLLNPVFRTSLLTAYARAGNLNSSLILFDEDAAPDIISWNAIINACLINHELRTSITLFGKMVNASQDFDSTTVITVLSAAARTQNLKQGSLLHCTIIKRNFDSNRQHLCNALLNLYAKCGDQTGCELVFGEMGANKDATSWNIMINGSLYNGFPEKSVFYFCAMAGSLVQPDRVSLSSVISACSCSAKFRRLGESVYGRLIKFGYQEHDCSVENSLISFYSRQKDVEAAREVFDGLLHKNIVTWNSMIYGLVENRGFDEALQLFRELLLKVTPAPNAVTLIAIIPACHMLDQAKSIYAFAIRQQIEDPNLLIPNCLLDIYINHEDFASADRLFKAMPNKDSVSWNTIISGYSKNEQTIENARILFKEMLHQDVRCSLATLLGVLSSCSDPHHLNFGKSLHCWGLKSGFVSGVIQAVNALVMMYINCGDMLASCLLFTSFLSKIDIVSWNTISAGYARYGLHEDVLETFRSIRRFSDLRPDPITYVSVLSACGNLGLIPFGTSVHALMRKSSEGLDLMAKNALITMYFRCERPESAELVFQTYKDRNLCTWNCMISGFAQNKGGEKALEYFQQMGSYRANEFSIVGVLCACSRIGNLKYGTEVHGFATRSGLSENCFILSALIDMYSKCGRLAVSVTVFEKLSEKPIAAWNSMISAFGLHGHGEQAIKMFSVMSKLGIRPTRSTFIALLSACSHSGLVDEGCRYYSRMKEEFGVAPSIEHDVCLVDMLGRAGRIGEAHNLVRKSSSETGSGTWGAVLSSCSDYANLEMGKSVAEHLFRLEPDNIGYYVTLSNLYAYHELWSKAEEVRSRVYDRRLMKPSGHSLICI